MNNELKNKIRNNLFVIEDSVVDDEWDESFIREIIECEEFNWLLVSQFQKLSNDFIREFADKLEWNLIASCQKIDFNLVKEFKNKLNWGMIVHNPNLSNKVKMKYMRFLSKSRTLK